MATGVGQRIRHLPFRGTDDPSLPVGMWICDVESTGDASGGENSLDVIFSDVGNPEEGFFSLEQLLDQHDVVTSEERALIFNNQRNFLSPTTPITSTFLLASGTGLLGRTGFLGRDANILPYFLGTPPRVVSGVQLFIRLSISNTDLIAFRMHCWGYRWGARAFDTPTGPRRPVGSVFGA